MWTSSGWLLGLFVYFYVCIIAACTTQVGSFCCVRAHLYHDLYHYKRRVCAVLARHLRSAMQSTASPDDAVTAVLGQEDVVNGLRQGLATLVSAAQGLQIGQGTSRRFGHYGAGQGAVFQAARQMGMRDGGVERDDWQMADRALAGMIGGHPPGEDAQDADEAAVGNGNAGGRRTVVLLSSDEEEMSSPRRVTTGTQTCEEMHRHAIAVLTSRLD